MDLYELRRELLSGRSIYDLPVRVSFYARVSTEKDEQAHSLKNQVAYYSDLIRRNPNWVYCDGYIDEGLSGTSVGKRGSFLRMIEDAKKGRFDFIITKEISRFSRNTLDSIRYTQELLQHGVGVLFESDNINTLLPDSELRLTIMASIAQDEVRKISERVRFGFRRAVDQGVVLGNSRIWGYTKQEGRLVIEEKEAEIIRLIFDLYANQNLGIRSIRTRLAEEGFVNTEGNPFSFSTIQNILTNPKYKGWYCGRKSTKYDYRSSKRKSFAAEEWLSYPDHDKVPPIISEALWEKANRILQNRSKKMSGVDKTSYQNKYPYSGKIFCGEHGVAYYRRVYQYAQGSKEVWQCQRYAQQGKAGCSAPAVYTQELNEIVGMGYRAAVVDRGEIAEDLIRLYTDLQKGINPIEKLHIEQKQLELKKERLLELTLEGGLFKEEFRKRNQAYNLRLLSLKQQIEELEQEAKKQAEHGGSHIDLRRVIDEELEFGEGFDAPIVELLVDTIEVRPLQEQAKVMLQVDFKLPQQRVEYTLLRSRNKPTQIIQSERAITSV